MIEAVGQKSRNKSRPLRFIGYQINISVRIIGLVDERRKFFGPVSLELNFPLVPKAQGSDNPILVIASFTGEFDFKSQVFSLR